jgi:hypothetical protein
VGLVRSKVNWVLDADIRSFFDRMSHEWTMKFVQHRVADNRIPRLKPRASRSSASQTSHLTAIERGLKCGKNSLIGSAGLFS